MNTQETRKTTRLIFALLATLFLSACLSGNTEAQVDWQTPAFELSDSEGNVFRYPQDLDGPTIILFWASWCPYCKSLMPHLQSIVDEYAGGIEVLALNFRDDEDPSEFMAEYGYDFRLFPHSDPIAESWGVKTTPGLFLVDASGLVMFSNYSITEAPYQSDPADQAKNLKHYQRAARKMPFVAAQLRIAIDKAR